MRVAGLKVVGLCKFDLRGLFTFCRGYYLPVGHLGLAHGLAVNRPGRAVIVRKAFLGPIINMRTDAEPKVRVFVNDVALWFLVFLQMSCNEFFVLQRLLYTLAYLLLSGRAGIRLQRVAAVGGKLI